MYVGAGEYKRFSTFTPLENPGDYTTAEMIARCRFLIPPIFGKARSSTCSVSAVSDGLDEIISTEFGMIVGVVGLQERQNIAALAWQPRCVVRRQDIQILSFKVCRSDSDN